MSKGLRNLVVVLGDQLDRQSSALVDLDPDQDRVWMAEVSEESTQVWSHKARTALFLSAMRHFRDGLKEEGIKVHYRQLDDKGNRGSLAAELRAAIHKYQPERLIMVEPGDWRVQESMRTVAKEEGL